MTAGAIRDDRGRWTTVYRAVDRIWSPRARAELPQDEFESIASAIGDRANARFRKRKRLGARVAVGAAVGLLIAAGLAMTPRLGWVWAVWSSSLVIALAVASYAWNRFTLMGAHAHGIREALLAHRRCAACGYALGGLEPDESGCAVCPECGSAWRLPEPESSSSR